MASSPEPDMGLGDVPASTKRELAVVDSALGTSIALWLRKRGKAVRPKLSSEQKQQLKECFELMDQDGSGAIDADELGAAFKLLGIRMRKAEIEELLAEVDHDGSGEVEYPEFLEIMTSTLQRLAEEREASEFNHGESQVPFALMATAYRRKRLMEGIISGDKEVMTQITQLSEKQAQEALAIQQAHGHGRGHLGSRGTRSGDGGGGMGSADAKKIMNSITKRSLARLQAMHVDEDLLASLTPEERRLLSQVAAKAHGGGSSGSHSGRAPRSGQGSPGRGSLGARGPSPGAAGAGSGAPPRPQRLSGSRQVPTAGGLPPTGLPARRGPDPRLPSVPSRMLHYSQTASHQQLMETPQVFDLQFSRPTIKINTSRPSMGGLPSTTSVGSLPALPGSYSQRQLSSGL